MPGVSDAHGRPAREAPLTPVDTAAPSHAERARTLVSHQRTGALGTLDADGFPHVSFVTFALDGASPVFLVSELATHTQHLLRDARASLLVHESGPGDPLASGRVTLVGPCERLADARSARAAFLAAHPSAAFHADFKDFAFYRLEVRSVRFIGGFGRMSWVDAADWQAAQPDPLAPACAGILAHMNTDHAEALVLYARAFSTATEATEAVMTGIDRLGFELSVGTPLGTRPARIAFASEITTPAAAREALVRLVTEARAKLAAR